MRNLRFCVIAYDIADNRRRERVAKTLEECATRIQHSVFECHLTEREILGLAERLEQFVTAEDQLRIYPMPQTAMREIIAMGGAPPEAIEDYWLL